VSTLLHETIPLIEDQTCARDPTGTSRDPPRSSFDPSTIRAEVYPFSPHINPYKSVLSRIKESTAPQCFSASISLRVFMIFVANETLL